MLPLPPSQPQDGLGLTRLNGGDAEGQRLCNLLMSCTSIVYEISAPSRTSNMCTSVLLCSKDARVHSVSRTTGASTVRSVISGIARRKIRAIRVMEYQRAHAGLRVHHEAFRQLHADFFGFQ